MSSALAPANLGPLTDCHPPADDMAGEVVAGLERQPRALPCKYFYDAKGSALFDAICELPAYYPTRTELAIMADYARAMAAAVGPGAMVVEYGSGSSVKTRYLLDALADPAAYVPIDISRDHLLGAAAELAASYPNLEVLPVCADYTAAVELPAPTRRPVRRVAYFPGSTIGNFDPGQARAFLRRVAALVGPGGGLLLGFDLKKDRATLEAAYNDPEGVTAAFNRNLLDRLNRELGADFDLAAWSHRAFYNAEAGRIEMHLVSGRAQTVTVAGRRFRFAAGETIHTENSHKFHPGDIEGLAAAAGFSLARVWSDPGELFAVGWLVAAG